MTKLLTSLCDYACDRIANDESLPFARFALFLAHIIDPRESHHAAHIRDTIRDAIDNAQL
jgi:hypothetical protein